LLISAYEKKENYMALNIKWIGSPNKRKSRSGFRPEAVVIHIMEGTLKGTDSWFKNPDSKVSAHYGIGLNGEVHQYVLETDTAQHAGRKSNSSWNLVKSNVNPNLYTIGIEHEGKGDTAWTDAMYHASAELVREICTRWHIPMDRNHIIGHREIYGVKTCPGSQVSLDRLIKLAKDGALNTTNYNFIPLIGTVKTRNKLNIRQGAPTSVAQLVRTAPAEAELAYIGYASNGQNVSGNAHWYKNAEGNYFWAGGTQQPVPGM
jgi:N-acetylmuramoyl-L-alanine amidase